MSELRVEQRVLRARIRLALAQPFLASALMRLPLRAVPGASWCPTAATDGYHVFYNPAWFAKLSSLELRGVLAHEVLHVLFAHAERRLQRDARRWNVACDHAINLLLVQQGFAMPDGALLDARWQGMTAEQVFAKLPPETGRRQIARPLGAAGAGAPGTSTTSAAAAQAAAGESDRDTGKPGTVPGIGVDLLDPDAPQLRPLRGPDAPDAEQLDELRRELRAAALAGLQAESADLFKSECEADDARRLDWRALLRSFLHERIKGDWQSYPFSKRHLHRGLFMPSPGLAVPGHVVFAIDTSGSMPDAALAQILGELTAFRQTFPSRLTVLQADSQVRSVHTFEAMDGAELPRRLPIVGRGATDFRPVFEWVAQQGDAAVVLYATDALGTFPRQAPATPVIWLLTPPHARPQELPFGQVVAMPTVEPAVASGAVS